MQIKYKILSLRESGFKFDYEYKLKDKNSISFDFYHREKADFEVKNIIVEVGARIVVERFRRKRHYVRRRIVQSRKSFF